ncbi:MAG: citrate/2-methylcitrate synthase [Actinomycetota bacterium]
MEELIAPPGLKGLVVADTTIGSVRGDEGFYHYRDHDAVDIARHQSFEAAARLLIDGALPDPSAESAFRSEIAAARRADGAVLDALAPVAGRIDAMSALRLAFALAIDDTPTIDLTGEERRERALAAAALVPTVMAALHRLAAGQAPLAPDPGLGHTADYLRMVTGSCPSAELIRAVETYLLLTIDHGFNASTFTARVVTSTGAGVASAMSAAVGALSGPLHGGAPSRVLDMLSDIGAPANTETWAEARLARGDKIMGFGHAVYRADDPRSDLLKEVAIGLGGSLVDQALEIEERMLAVLRAWRPGAAIVTNVEYYAAIVLHLAGLPQELFTPTFTASRVVGWAAHILEQADNNKIMRPKARYVGPEPVRR